MAKETMVETVVTAEGGEFNEEEVRAAVKAAIDAAQEPARWGGSTSGFAWFPH